MLKLAEIFRSYRGFSYIFRTRLKRHIMEMQIQIKYNSTLSAKFVQVPTETILSTFLFKNTLMFWSIWGAHYLHKNSFYTKTASLRQKYILKLFTCNQFCYPVEIILLQNQLQNRYRIMKNKLIDHFTTQQLDAIRQSLSYRLKIEQFLNKFEYKNNRSYHENITNFCQDFQASVDLETKIKHRFIVSFKQFVLCEQNVPIQVNFKTIKFQQLTSLVKQWEKTFRQPSIIRPSQRLYSIEHRNILFSRVFVEQRQNIEEYFETLSQKKMLKAVDLYHLLVDTLSHYFLYEYASDNETFFEKVNSFNNFLEVVEQFIHSQGRIIIDNKSKDFEYIKLYEFQALIYFWESINSELQVRSDKRFSNCNQQVQTERHQIMQHLDRGVQTVESKEKILTLQDTIRSTLKQLNKLTEDQNQPQRLEIIQNICESLRKEKIKLVHFQKSLVSATKKLSPRITADVNNRVSICQDQPINIRDEQKQLQLQKTQRISMKGLTGVQQVRESISRRQSPQRTAVYKQQRLNVLNSLHDHERYKKIPDQLKIPQKTRQKLDYSDELDSNNESSILYSKSSNPLNDTQIYSKHTNILSSDSKIINGNKQKSIQILSIDCSQALVLNQTQNLQINPSTLKLLQNIFKHYANPQSGFINMESLNRFLIDIGVIQQNQTALTLGLIKKSFVKNVNKIKIIQFLEIMDQIMKQDTDLTFAVIQQFVDLQIRSQERKINKNILKSSHKVQKQSCQALRNQSLQKRMTREIQSQLEPQSSSRKRRYKYCEQTPKFSNSKNPNLFQQARSKLSPQKRANIPVLNLGQKKPYRQHKY